MRVIIILASIALAHGAKLERTYLPPSNARTAGGSGNFLQTPLSGPGSSGSRPDPTRNYNAQTGFSQGNSGTPQANYALSGNDYSQSGNGFSQSGNDFSLSGNDLSQTGAQYENVDFNNFAGEARPERPRAAFERNAAILRQDSSNDGENFSYAYETENGIYAEESGIATNGVEAQGGYSYTGDDGQVYSIRYTADQNGFVPQGDHLPTPPPVPEEILKALEQNARDEAAGIYDDGSYNEGKYAAADNNNYNQYYQQNTFNGNGDDAVVTNSALARSGPTINSPRNGPASTYGTPNSGNSGFGQTYGAPSTPSGNSGIDQTYGTPNAPSFNSGNSASAPAFGARTYNAPSGNTASFAAGTGSSSFAAPNAGTINDGASRNSGIEKAYLPPFADQRGQDRNTFGRRQQSFDARTGYKY